MIWSSLLAWTNYFQVSDCVGFFDALGEGAVELALGVQKVILGINDHYCGSSTLILQSSITFSW
jgi:hypothetical protein